jgi:hypothetical protein
MAADIGSDPFAETSALYLTVEAANKAKNLSDQGVVHCRDTNPLAGAGT